jgi:hypothetical protein
MGKSEIELNSAGVRELLKSKEIRSICKEYADKAVRKLGDGYSANVYDGSNRVNVSVMAVQKQAQEDNLKNNTILKAVLSK